MYNLIKYIVHCFDVFSIGLNQKRVFYLLKGKDTNKLIEIQFNLQTSSLLLYYN